MCFFVAQFIKASQARTRYWNSVLQDTCVFKDNYVASGFEHPNLLIVKQEEEPTLEMAQWGLIPNWCKTDEDAKELSAITINARCETIFEKPSFKESAKHKRCLLPVNGFFEYQHVDNQKIPYYISLKDEEIFSIGALYAKWTSTTTGETIQTFSIITTPANPLLETIHNTKMRMPLIIPAKNEKDWLQYNLSENEVLQFLKTYPENSMQAWRVNPLISKGKSANTHRAIESTDTPSLF